jgi:hypothetical protein
MNKTVRDILAAEFYSAKRTLANEKQSLQFAVQSRINKESQLSSAKRFETEAALTCQKAAG